ncbi:MAG: DNA-directed RNA polymerase subunit beta [Deltaproteobacteria bacterium]|nr:DNA-directed RNA polymerase subunit beta [Deltaproteobacteria bacterium]MBW2075228.1 DNA-directed RNA polymerase subunit beta [Deltaproteobacteria bacterium]RLB80893.1 MAG: DNA-directed RNA polymerase subunit beta [Deltaproteobacteria bacterium]
MPKRFLASKRIRRDFGKIPKVVAFPNLVEMQKESYARFLQQDVSPEKRKDEGLQAAFKSVFPIRDFTGTASLEFVSYGFGEVKYDEYECIHKGMTYEIPVRITVRLVVYETDKETGVQNIRDIKEQEIYFGTIPLMTKRGTFIINGTERVVVSQLHRSPGVFFDHDKGKTHSSGKVLYTARIMPVRGSWIDLEIDPKDIVYVRIDRRRKFPATLLLKAFGYSGEEILSYFYRTEKIQVEGKRLYKVVDKDLLVGQRASKLIKHPQTGETIIKKGYRITKRTIKQLLAGNVERIPIGFEDIENKVLAHTLVDPGGEVVAAYNDVIDEEVFERILNARISSFEILYIDNVTTSDSIRKTLLLDKVETQEDALLEIYRRLRPSNPPTLEVAQELCHQLFFSPSHYDLSPVGRLKTNIRLGQDVPLDVRTLRKEDVLLTAKILVELKDRQGPIDDIDHLGNRRVRAVGELLENQYRIGLVRMERAIKERMSLQEIEALMPHDLINSKPVSAVIKEFFGTSQLSQFMDQTNPLSEITHKRRLSALGPGGLTRERAGFEVRDVHPTHYGRICPIETPEGPNIGLIVSLSTYARVNKFGFIETPYRVVKDGQVTDTVKFLTALDEEKHPIAQANAPLDEEGRFANPLVSARIGGEFLMVKREEIELMDISPDQLVSVSASLIPFLENDDANRALMGSNMQRQAVPLLVSSAPLVGTGVEGVVAKDSGVTVVAECDGEVVDVDAKRIVVKHSGDGNGSGRQVTIYNLTKFSRSNQNTCFNQRPIVNKGDRVKRGDVIADGPATKRGELALGKNVMVAFMPWGGYNFEDSILVSERLVRDGVFTSIHIEELETVARDTKLGKEEITRDIPNVGEEALKNLDDSGIIRLGAEVKPGDILVGKITPKGETQLSPEEKLLRAIFGEKAGDVKDTSLSVPPGVNGVVIDAKVFSRRGVDKDARTQSIEKHEIEALERDRDDELAIIEEVARESLRELLVDQTCAAPFKKGKVQLIKKGERISAEALSKIPVSQMAALELKDANVAAQMNDIVERYRQQCDQVRKRFENQTSRYERGDELPPGVIKMVKIYVAMKRRLSVGDKMAGRHGNKGVVSCILPQEDMPYFEDGTPLDIVLNPLGVPSRMNVGQILETHLGWAAKGLGDQINELVRSENHKALRKKLKSVFPSTEEKKQIARLDDRDLINFAKRYREGAYMATPVFDGAKESEIKDLLAEAGCPVKGQATLYDGRTGEPFATKVTVGIMYMMKLHHLVDDKIHARSIGPYSLVTQQPLGGKAQFGGQRLGEMEVWAMEAYGAAYALQEFLTVKSDDMAGRTRMYEKIVKGENVLEAGLPESFNVLVKELEALGLDVELLEKKN